MNATEIKNAAKTATAAPLSGEAPAIAMPESGETFSGVMLRERMQTAFDAAQRSLTSVDDSFAAREAGRSGPEWKVDAAAVGLRRQTLERMNALAPLYFKFAIPSWPPRLLVRKIVRRLLFPFFASQVAFNEAARDCAAECYAALERKQTALQNADARFRALEEQVERLENRILQTEQQSSIFGTAGMD